MAMALAGLVHEAACAECCSAIVCENVEFDTTHNTVVQVSHRAVRDIFAPDGVQIYGMWEHSAIIANE